VRFFAQKTNMEYTDEVLNQVTDLGILGYSIDKIISLIAPENAESLRADILLESHPLSKAYWKGKTTGQYLLDKALFDKATKDEKDTVANDLIFERIRQRKINDIISEKFGL
jgi:hypothetical protein